MSKIFTVILRKIGDSLENANYPSVGPCLFFLGTIGLWHPTITKSTVFKLFIFFITIIFFLSQYINCLITLSLDALKLIIHYAPVHMGFIKACFFQKDHRSWEKLINFTARLEKEQYNKNDSTINQIINKYIASNRRVTYFFWTLVLFCNIIIFPTMCLKNQIVQNGTSVYSVMFDNYNPFKKDLPGYAIIAIQLFFGNLTSAYICGWDGLVVSLMIFYSGQAKIACLYCQRMIDVGNKEKSRQNIVEFHRYYMDLVEYQKLFNTLMSPVMFIYLIVISVNLGVCIIQIIELNKHSGDLLSSIVLVLGCLIQLLIFYWLSNEVSVDSMQISYATYESDWTVTDNNLQRDVLLLGVTTSNRMVFTAGPFHEMSLYTFVAILRLSYSFYTLMHGAN